jgi:uncharacterized membrane protein (DUF2068 family)
MPQLGHFRLDPDAHYPRILINDAELLANANLRQVVLLAWAYAAIRLAEGYVLWKERAWAEWLAALSGGVDLSLEVIQLAQHTTIIKGMVPIGTVVVVGYLVHRLWRRK